MRAIAASVFLALLGGMFILGCANRQPLTTVSHVDLGKYSGQWYEVARYPNWFQRNCVGEVTATYRALPDGSIEVVNSCRDKSGRMDTVKGKAVVVPDSENAKLKVRFFGPFSGDYWVIGLDEKSYSWAVVGHPSRRYLWILSRSKAMRPSDYEKAITIAKNKGYDLSRLIKTRQP
jgi:apolipoprotein D and lipocalin family protein